VEIARELAERLCGLRRVTVVLLPSWTDSVTEPAPQEPIRSETAMGTVAPMAGTTCIGSDRAKEQRFDPADLFVKFMERLAIPPKNT
jgi:hypothetical protein